MMSVFHKTSKLMDWLTNRDWFVNAPQRIIRQYDRECEQARIKATRELTCELKRLHEQANADSNNSQWERRYRRQALTEAKKIMAEIERLNETIPYGERSL
jgi:hypothetical protein